MGNRAQRLQARANKETISRIIKFGNQKAELIFNYKTKYNQVWDNEALKEQYGYSVTYTNSSKNNKTVSS